MAQPKHQPLNERIETLRAEIDAFIDTLAARDAKACPGVPVQVLRQLLTAKGNGCLCAAYLQLAEEDMAV